MFEQIMVFVGIYLSGFLGHLLVFLFMTVESTFIPFPSELILIPAGAFAFAGNLNIYLVIIFGTLGSVFGALINYFLGYYLGRKYILKHRKLFFINIAHMDKSDSFFKKYGKSATFFGRLIPVVRQYLSIPAGFSKMPLKNFIIFTFAGSLLWVSFLSIIGYKLGEELSKSIVSFVNIFIILLVCILVIILSFWYFYGKIKK